MIMLFSPHVGVIYEKNKKHGRVEDEIVSLQIALPLAPEASAQKSVIVFIQLISFSLMNAYP